MTVYCFVLIRVNGKLCKYLHINKPISFLLITLVMIVISVSQLVYSFEISLNEFIILVIKHEINGVFKQSTTVKK